MHLQQNRALACLNAFAILLCLNNSSILWHQPSGQRGWHLRRAWLQDCQHRRPYELLLLLQREGCQRSLPQGFCMFASPRQHSRKPPLGGLLADHLPSEPGCLEVCLSHQGLLQSFGLC